MTIQHGDGVVNTIEETAFLSSLYSECASCHQQGHTSTNTLLQQNSPLLNWGAV